MEIEPHSTLKNRALGVYYRICIEVIKKRQMLYYIDLFSGDGENVCRSTENIVRPAPFITQFLESAEKRKINIACYLNDINPDNCKKLKKNVTRYAEFIREIKNKDANEVYKEFLKEIPKDKLCIIFLDPFKYTQLDFKTIEAISKHEIYDAKSGCKRKPELIINLMTCTMQRNARINKNSVANAIGKGEWMKLIDENTEDLKTYEILHDSFIKNLEGLGYFTTSIEIRQTPPLNSVLYYLIFASSIPAAHKIHERFKKDISQYQQKWSKANYRLKLMSELKAKGMKPLNEYF